MGAERSKERRFGLDRRQFSYTLHIPERRCFVERRGAQQELAADHRFEPEPAYALDPAEYGWWEPSVPELAAALSDRK